jgi:hypothetical protein
MNHHNKKTNIGLIYEFLSHEVASRMLKNKETKSVFDVIEKYFKNSVLKEELEIFKAISSLKGKEEVVVKKSLKEIAKFAQKINRDRSLKLKTDLIKEIKEKLSDKVFDYKIDNYRLYASIQMFINSAQKGTLKESIDNVNFENEVIKILAENLKEDKKCSKTKVDNFLFISAIDNITESMKSLNESQKSLMLRYLDSISTSSTKKFFGDILNENKNNFGFKTLNEEISKKLIVAKKKFENCLSDDHLEEDQKLRIALEYVELFDEIRGNK